MVGEMKMRTITLCAALLLAACASGDPQLAKDRERCEAYGFTGNDLPQCIMKRDMQRERFQQQRMAGKGDE